MSRLPQEVHLEQRPLSSGQLAKLHDVSIMIVKRALWRDRIPYFKLGREHRVPYHHAISEETQAVLRKNAEWTQHIAYQQIYFIGAKEGPVKIGKAYKPEVRLREIQTGNPLTLSILALAKGGQGIERAYHTRFAAHRLHGEWFDRAPEILAEIERLSA